MEKSMEKINIILFGKPGAGKRNTSKFSKENYNLSIYLLVISLD
jgi:hypothetical protein